MAKYRIDLTDDAIEDFRKIRKSGDKSTLVKLEKIIRELEEHPYSGTGRPERLKYRYAGYYSRRLNQKDRLIYKVEDHIVTVTIVAARDHYQDK